MSILSRAVAAALLTASILGSGASLAAGSYSHVLLISVDGLHALDLANYVVGHPASTFAALVRSGIDYPNALTTTPSDSFPGTLALVTGGTPKATGVFYDDSFVRDYFKPGSDCSGAPGAEVILDSSVDVNPDNLDGGGTPGVWTTQIDPKKLPVTLVDGECVAVFPHSFSRVNDIFEIVKAHGGRTAWSDKHPSYEMLAGPSGKGLDDLFSLEQDSLIPGTKIATTGSFKSERDFDEARVQAVINEIKGMDSRGLNKAPVPALFGLNFQAVSVGQKLQKSGPGDVANLLGGYSDATGAPNNGLALQLDYVDGAVGELTAALKANNLSDNTLIVIASKHGQSPIDLASLQRLDDDPYTKTPGYAFHIADDASLIWLDPKTRAANVGAARQYLEANAKALGIGKLWTPNMMAMVFNDPATDSRTPDFMVTVDPGVVYTSGTKIAEHGGANLDDRNVAVLISNPHLQPKVVAASVETTQVAPTILKALGLDPNELQAVQMEGTQELPALPF